jgi:hypothetical protein
MASWSGRRTVALGFCRAVGTLVSAGERDTLAPDPLSSRSKRRLRPVPTLAADEVSVS